jgi:hypothetical protein
MAEESGVLDTKGVAHRKTVSNTSERFVAFSRRAAVPLLILLHLALTIPLAYRLNIWLDEAFTLHTTGAGLRYAFQQATGFEMQAPLYFILLGVWRKLNDSIFFARLFSVACIALTIKVAASLSRRFIEEIHPGWVAAAVAFNPFVIWAALEIRLYAFALLLSALLLVLFHDGYLKETTQSKRARILYLFVCVLALYTQYYLGFQLVAHACALLALRRWRALGSYLVGMLVVGLCFAPMMVVVYAHMTGHSQYGNNALPIIEGFRFIARKFYLYLLPTGDISHDIFKRWILRLGLLVALIFIWKKGRTSLTTERLALLSITTALSILFLIAVFLTDVRLLQDRHTAALFLPTILLAFSLVALAPKIAPPIWTLIIALFYATTLYASHAPLAKNGDWQRVASHVMAHEKPGQPILVFRGRGALTLSYYYTGQNPIVPLPSENRYDTLNLSEEVLRDEQQVADAISRVPGSHDELWVIMDGDPKRCVYEDLNYNCQILESYLEKHYAVEASQDFFRSRVRLLRRKSGP